MSRKNYIDRVKKGQEVYQAMDKLTKDNDTLTIEFGNRGEFEIRMHSFSTGRSYSINNGQLLGKQMNIDLENSSKSYLYCYAYDLFQNKTSAKLYFEHITIK